MSQMTTLQEQLQTKIAKVIDKSWHDRAFKQQLVADTTGTLKAQGIDLPAGVRMRAVENTDTDFYLVLQPRGVLPEMPNLPEQQKKITKVIEKAWRDPIFKQQLSTDTAETLKAEGIDLPAGVRMHVVENTDTDLYFVLPAAPRASGELSDEDLEQISGGPTAVEYAVMLALIIVVCISAVSTTGTGTGEGTDTGTS